jgi:itaconate CoA-transferase
MLMAPRYEYWWLSQLRGRRGTEEGSQSERAAQGPLAGIKVVALEQAVALPFATFILAELGADVIKIERPGGDVIRGWDSVVSGVSTGFVWLNGGKRDISIDLRSVEGQTAAQRIVAGADVFVENFSPGVAARLGLSKGDIERVNPLTVYCSLSGFGQTGPYNTRKAYDLIIQGEGGLILTNGTPDAPAKIGIPLTDLIGGSTAAILILGALYEQRPIGPYLDVAMLDAVMPWLAYYPQFVWHANEEPTRSGLRHQYTVPYGPFMAKDGRYINVAVASTQHWRVFCESVVQHPEWVADSRFDTAEKRTQNRAILESFVEDEFATEPSSVWEERCEALGIPFGAVRTVGEALAHPQVLEREMVVKGTLGDESLPLIRFPGAAVTQDRHIPALGEHSRAVLSDSGFSDEETRQLIAQGTVIAGPN